MSSIPKVSAHFSTSLSSKITAAAASLTVVSGTDKAGNALSGLYGIVVDKGSATEEFMLGTFSGTTFTISARGLDPGDGKTEVTALKQPHRRGSTVDITDYPVLAILGRILNADESFPNDLNLGTKKITNLGTPSASTDAATKAYADGIAVAGGADASTTVKGISKASVAPVSATSPIFVGDNDPRVPTQAENDALVGTNGSPSTTNPFVTKLAQIRVRTTTAFETAARFTSTLTGGGAATFTTDGIALKGSGAASVGSAKVTLNFISNAATNAADQVPFDNSPSFTCRLASLLGGGLPLKGTFYCGIGAVTVASTGLTMTPRHAGFKIISDVSSVRLYATQADGTTENVSSLLATIIQGNTLDLYLKINGTGSIDYYYAVSGAAWSAATNLTANMPTGANGQAGVLMIALSNDNNAQANGEVDVASMTYER